MANKINHKIWKLLSQDYSVQKDLQRGLINTRALAKYFIKQYKLQASLDAVISAIRRYDMSLMFVEKKEDVDNILMKIDTFTRDHVGAIRIHSHSLYKLFTNDQFSELESNYRIIKSKKHAIIFLYSKELDTVLSFFDKEDIVRSSKNLAEIRIKVPEAAVKIRGILSRIMNEIASRSISVRDLIVCYPEIMVYVDRKDLLKAHEAIMHLHDEVQKKN